MGCPYHIIPDFDNYHLNGYIYLATAPGFHGQPLWRFGPSCPLVRLTWNGGCSKCQTYLRGGPHLLQFPSLAIVVFVTVLLAATACTYTVTATPEPTRTPAPIKRISPTSTPATINRSAPVRRMPTATPRQSPRNSEYPSDLVQACRNFQTQYLRAQSQGLSSDQIVAELSKTMTQQQIKTMALTCTVVLESAAGR